MRARGLPAGRAHLPGTGDGGFCQLPFERFERYCPYGTPDDVAEFLAPYADAGCTEFSLIPQSPDPGQAVAGVAGAGTAMTGRVQRRYRQPSAGAT